MAKISREDEIQADRYGLQLMSRAGYDPESMVTMMAHLGVLQDEHSDAVSKYLEDHPDPAKRVAHLMGYPELDPTTITPAQELVQASSDEERARYSFARLRLDQVLKTDPQSSEALLELGQSELALGLTKQERADAWRRPRSSARRRRAPPPMQRIAALRQMEAQRSHADQADPPESARRRAEPRRPRTRPMLREIQARAAEGKDQLKSVQSRLETLQYEVPDLSRINITPRVARRSDREEPHLDGALAQ